MELRPHFARYGALFLAIAGLLAPAAHADSTISFLDIFDNTAFAQVGDGNSLVNIGYFFSADLNSVGTNVFTSASFTPPGGSATNLPQISGTDFHYQTSFFPSQAAMQSSYPFGTYNFSGTGASPANASFSFTSTDYAQTNPYLTGNDYTELQGFDPLNDFTFTFSPFVPGGGPYASVALIFFSIFDETTNTTVVDDGFLPSNTTSVVVPAGTFTPGDFYDYSLDYSDRDTVTSPGAVYEAQLGFDIHTDGTFTAGPAVPPAATPEPSGILLLGTGLLGIAALLRWRKPSFR
jgi:hypothetical protein